MAKKSGLKLPPLTRRNKSKGVVHSDFDVNDSLIGLFNLPKARWWDRSSLSGLCLDYFDRDDAEYRRDFLVEWVDEKESRRNLDQITRMIPSRPLSQVITDSEWGGGLSDGSIRKQVSEVKRYLRFAEITEKMAEYPGSSDAAKDLRDFGLRARKRLNNYERYASRQREVDTNPRVLDPMEIEELREDGEDENDLLLLEEGFDPVMWANDVVDDLQQFLPLLDQIRMVRGQLEHYKKLAAPYELEFKGNRVPYCIPEFLDGDRMKGEIRNAYNPKHWKISHGKEGKKKTKKVTKLNVPNDVLWGGRYANYNFIYGPNNRGKSVYTNAAALNMHLAMAGMFPFADSARLVLPGRLYPCFDMGDTLGAGHFAHGGKKVKEMRDNVRLNDMVFLDETGGGTEPYGERQIFQGVTYALMDAGIPFFCSGHQRGIWNHKPSGARTRVLQVADWDNDERKFQVWPGVAAAGYSLRIAEQMGIDPEGMRAALRERLYKKK